LRALRDYTRLKRDATPGGDQLAWSLVLESLIFAAEAEVRWLDHVEMAVIRAATAQPREVSAGAVPATTPSSATSPPIPSQAIPSQAGASQ
jgi:hypothetical protein